MNNQTKLSSWDKRLPCNYPLLEQGPRCWACKGADLRGRRVHRNFNAISGRRQLWTWRKGTETCCSKV